MERLWLAVLLSGIAMTCTADLVHERDLDSGRSFDAHLVSYDSSGLKVYAMVAVPRAPMPTSGFPVVVANHGHVPDPRQYGITADGRDSRPGDYYRSVPELFAARGFLVVLPDYRGHNSSEGYELIEDQSRDSLDRVVGQYGDDVIALIDHLDDIPNADLRNVFLWSHSMGGGVALHTLLQTKVIRAASFWSTMELADFARSVSELSIPVIIHHGLGDSTTSAENSRALARALQAANRPHALHEYAVDEHFFSGDLGQSAADRDAEFFRRATTLGTSGGSQTDFEFNNNRR